MKVKNVIIFIIILIVLLSVIIIKNKQKQNTETIAQIEDEQTIEEKVILKEYVKTLEDGSLKNNSEKLKKNKEIDGCLLSNIRIIDKDNKTTMLIDIQNITSINKQEKNVTLQLKDEKDEEIGNIGMTITSLKANECATIEMETEKIFINTYDFEILEKELDI